MKNISLTVCCFLLIVMACGKAEKSTSDTLSVSEKIFIQNPTKYLSALFNADKELAQEMTNAKLF